MTNNQISETYQLNKLEKQLKRNKLHFFDRLFKNLSTLTVMFVIDYLFLHSGYVITLIVAMFLGIGFIKRCFSFLSLAFKVHMMRKDVQPVTAVQQKTPPTPDFYRDILQELKQVKDKISDILQRSSENIKAHSKRFDELVDGTISAVKVLVAKGRHITDILKNNPQDKLARQLNKLEVKLGRATNPTLRGELIKQRTLLQEQQKKYQRLEETEESIRIRIESAKLSLSSLILDLPRFDVQSEQLAETELDLAINNMESKISELDSLSELLDAERLNLPQ